MRGLHSTTEWEIDAKGVSIDGEGIIIVECRRHTKRRQNQESLAGLAYRIIDTGAQGGIIVSPLGLQEGATKVASAENIIEVQLQQDSTPKDFAMRFLDKMMYGVSTQGEIKLGGTLTTEVLRKCLRCGKTFVASGNERHYLDCIDM